SEILTGRLYISDLSVAHDQDGLARLGITHVVSVLEPTITPVLGPSFTQLHVGIEDSFRTNILQHFDRTTEFIRKALADNDNCKVLVHCMMGMSRSVAVVCAYLIAEKSMTSPDAIAYVRSRRSIARPNVGFAQQLEAYAKR
ncbi:protein-tyrosine phosphatase-like protein, partial [Amylostereum chailletii]